MTCFRDLVRLGLHPFYNYVTRLKPGRFAGTKPHMISASVDRQLVPGCYWVSPSKTDKPPLVVHKMANSTSDLLSRPSGRDRVIYVRILAFVHAGPPGIFIRKIGQLPFVKRVV